MRRWMRDRSKRRKEQTEKGPDQPAPLQPKFPEPVADDNIGNRADEPVYVAPAPAAAESGSLTESQPAAPDRRRGTASAGTAA